MTRDMKMRFPKPYDVFVSRILPKNKDDIHYCTVRVRASDAIGAIRSAKKRCRALATRRKGYYIAEVVISQRRSGMNIT